MPGMDGRELALRIRETSAGHLPLLFLTGNVTELASRRVPSLDDCTVLPKPVDFQALLDEIGRLLDIKWIFQSENDALSEETFLTLTSEEVTAQSPDDTQPAPSADTPLAANEKMELTELIDQVSELQMTGRGSRLARYAFHHVAITAQRVHMIVEQWEARLVEAGSQPFLGNRHTDGIATALSERTSGRLNACRVVIFRVARRLRIKLTELLEVSDSE